MDFSTNSITNIYNREAESSSKARELTNRLENTDFSKVSEEELKEVCKDFESYFVEQLFKSMEKMVPKSKEKEESSTSTLEYFNDMLIQEYASNAADQGSLGIAEMLYEQMKRNYNIPDAKTVEDGQNAESTAQKTLDIE